MASKDTCSEAIASAISDMDDGTEVTIELTGTVSTDLDGTKSLSGCSAIVEDESEESDAQEAAEKSMVPSGVSALAKKKMPPVIA